MNRVLGRLQDEAAIRDVMLRYCRGIDRLDWDLIRSCYHPDAYDDHGAYKGDVEGFIAWVAAPLQRFESTTHFVGNQTIEISGEVAWVETYVQAWHRERVSAGNATDYIVNFRYVDKLERRHSEWRIIHRAMAIDSERADPVSAEPEFNRDLVRGRRDREDISYLR